MSVVGIDFGNLQTVVAVARNRGIDVIMNEASQRGTPSLVSFGEKQRFLGEGAKTLEISNFKNTVGSLKRLLGRPYADPEVQQVEKPFLPANLVEGARGEVAASVYFQGEQRDFTFTQIAGMYFGKIKEFTSKEIRGPVTDVVISCPTWFTDRQRRALHDAASIQNLNVLRIINDTTASALGYGITKTDLPETTAKPRIVVFVDFGHSSLQVAVVAFVKGKLIVKGTAYDRNLGGRDFDEVLVNHYIEQFNAKYKLDIRSSAKAVYRLRQGCEKVKKTLSANAQAQLNVESLLDDKDVSALVQRSEYEEWLAPLLERTRKPIQEALDAAGVTKEDVDFVELVGGTTRVPAVKAILSDFFPNPEGGSKLSTTLNQDEAVSRGCALQCAMISPVFKVRDFAVQDWNTYPIELSWDASLAPAPKSGEAVETTMDAFPVGNQVPSAKILTFYRTLADAEINASSDKTVTLDISADYAESAAQRNHPVGTGKHIGRWTLKGIRKLAASDEKATIKIKAKLDGNLITSIESASQIEEVVVSAEEKKEDEKKEDAKDEATPMETDDAAKDSTSPTAPEGKTKKVVKKHDLVILSNTYSANPEQLATWQAEEGAMHAADRLIIDTAEKRNALEEYVYETRSKLDMAWSEFVADADRSAFQKQLNGMEDWLYGEGEDETKSVYVEKLAELKKVGDPIAKRYAEAEERPRAEKTLREYINSVIVQASAGDDRYAHIPKADLDKVISDSQAKLNWLNDAIAKQNETAKHVDPAVTSERILRERDLLQILVNPILTRPKPAPKKEEPKKEEEKKEEPKKEKKEEEHQKTPEDMDVD